MIQVIQTETRDPLRERQNLVQRWSFFLLFLVAHFVFLNVNHRSVSDKTPRGGKPKVLRNRLQSEDQVRPLFLIAFSKISLTRTYFNVQENLVAPTLVVARKHSLKSDALMSPHKVTAHP